MKKFISFALCLFLTLSVSVASEADSSTSSPVEKIRKSLSLVWHDEFNGTSIDKTKWRYETPYSTAYKQVYSESDSDGNARIENGNLVIEAKKQSKTAFVTTDKDGKSITTSQITDTEKNFDYTSARLYSNIDGTNKNSFKFGMMEARIKVPSTTGVFPAFWTTGYDHINNKDRSWPDTGEMDILESLNKSGTYSSSSVAQGIHYSANGSHKTSGGAYYTANGNTGDSYHTFGMYYSQTQLVFFVDNEITGLTDISSSEFNAFRTYAQNIILNVAVGVNNSAVEDFESAKMLVDYVRVYQSENDDYSNITVTNQNGYFNVSTLDTAQSYTLEAENLSYTTSPDAAAKTAVQAYDGNNYLVFGMPNADTSKQIKLGEYIDFSLQNIKSGKYTLCARTRAYSNRSSFDIAVDGTTFSTNVDFKTILPPSVYYKNLDIDCGEISINNADSKLRFTVSALSSAIAGTTASPSGFFIDKLILTPVTSAENCTVTIGEKVYYVENGGLFTFPALSKNGVAYYDANENYNLENDTIKVNENLSFNEAEINLSMQKGAAVRINAVTGIRFYTNVNGASVETLKSKIDDLNLSFGTLIAPRDLLVSDELTLDISEKSFVNVAYDAPLFSTINPQGYVGSIVSIKEANFARDFVGRGYVSVKIGAVCKTIYASYNDNDIANNSRSIGYISYMLKTQTNPADIELYNNNKDLIDYFASKYHA